MKRDRYHRWVVNCAAEWPEDAPGCVREDNSTDDTPSQPSGLDGPLGDLRAVPPKRAIICYSGVLFSPMNPEAADVRLCDIAHHLSLKARYGGATEELYSVAQHSVLCCAELVNQVRGSLAGGYWKRLGLLALLHDAAEAYIVDLQRPVKQCFPRLVAVEKRIQKVIYEVFDCTPPNEVEVNLLRWCDDWVAQRELASFFGLRDPKQSVSDNALIPTCWSGKIAETAFTSCWRQLCPITSGMRDEPIGEPLGGARM